MYVIFQTSFQLSFIVLLFLQRENVHKTIHREIYIFLKLRRRDKIENSNYNINEQKMDGNSRLSRIHLSAHFCMNQFLFSSFREKSIKRFWDWSEKFLSIRFHLALSLGFVHVKCDSSF